MSSPIWPLVTFGIAIAFLLIFRKPIDALIPRIKRIGSDGLVASHDPAADPMAAYRQAHRDEIERLEKRHAEQQAKNLEAIQAALAQQGKQIDELKKEAGRLADGLRTIQSFGFIRKFMADNKIAAFV